MMREILRQLVLEGVELYGKVCTVDAVNDMECDCTPIDDSAQILKVRLVADINADKKFVLVPKVGSYVIVSFLTDDVAYISMVSEVDKVYLKINDTLFQVDEDGYLISRGDESLYKILDDLLQAILQSSYQTNTGATVALINAATFTEIKERIPNILKSS